MSKIDINRLSRDYKEHPLRRGTKSAKGEIPTKEDLEYLYLELNLSALEVAKYFNRDRSFISKCFSQFGIVKPVSKINEITTKTFLNRYGVSHPRKSRNVIEKFKKTCFEKYGVDHPLKSSKVRERGLKTLRERYGVDNPMKSKDIKSKAEKTNLEKYGVSCVFKNRDIQEKIQETNIKKYGVPNPLLDKDIKDKAKATCISHYGVDNPFKNKGIQEKIVRTNKLTYGCSSPQTALISSESQEILNNKEKLLALQNSCFNGSAVEMSKILGVSDGTVGRYLKKHNIPIKRAGFSSYEKELMDTFKNITFIKDRTILDGQEIDLYSPEHKIGIEFNGNYWHSDGVLLEKRKKSLKDTINYHRDKSIRAQEKGVFLYHIFEYEWLDDRKKRAIINQLRNLFNLNSQKVFARNCFIKEVSNSSAKEFFELNHVQGNVNSGIKLGLYFNNELVSLMSFAKNAINKNYEYELNRFCSKAGCNVVGGASKLFKYFLNTYKPTSIISYSDIAKTTGKLYQSLGFKLLHISKPQYVWTNGVITLNRYKTQLKKLIKQGWKSEKDSKTEDEIMRSKNFLKLYDCGKKVWIYHK